MPISKKVLIAFYLIAPLKNAQAAHVVTSIPIPIDALRATRSFAIEHEKRTKLIAEWTPLPTVLQNIVCSYEEPCSGIWSKMSTIKDNSWWFTPDHESLVYLSSDRIAAGTNEGYIQICDPTQGTIIQRTNRSGWFNIIHTLIHDAATSEIIAGTEKGAIDVWDDKTYKHLCTIAGATSCLTSLSFFNASRTLVSGSKISNQLCLWNMAQRAHRATLLSPSEHTTSLATLSEDRFVSTGSDPYLRIWDINTQKVAERSPIAPERRNLKKAIVLDSPTIAIAYNNQLVLYDVRSKKIASQFGDDVIRITNLLFHHGTLISQSGDIQESTIKLQDLRNLKEPLQVIKFAGNWFYALAGDPYSSAFSASAQPATIHTWALRATE